MGVVESGVSEAELSEPFRAQEIVSESQILGNELCILLGFCFAVIWL